MSNYELIRPTSHEDWLENRKSGIGSSDVGTILGLNPFQTPYQLWLRKTGKDTSVQEENFAMKAGHYLEDAVSKFFSDETGAVIQKNSATDFIVRSKQFPFMQVSPDRFFRLGDKKKRILECKTTQRQIDIENVPKYWFVQLQYQLAICEMDEGSLAWLTAGREFNFQNYTLDEDLKRYIFDRVSEFWLKNVCELIEPDAINVDDVKLKFATSTDTSVIADAEILTHWEELKELKANEKVTKERIEALENAIKVKMGGSERLETGSGELLASWKSSKPRTTFDSARFKADHPDQYANYLKEGASSRTFKLY